MIKTKILLESRFALINPHTNLFYQYQPHLNTYLTTDFNSLKPADILLENSPNYFFPIWKKKPTSDFEICSLLELTNRGLIQVKKTHFIFSAEKALPTIPKNSNRFKTYGLPNLNLKPKKITEAKTIPIKEATALKPSKKIA